LILWWAECLTT